MEDRVPISPNEEEQIKERFLSIANGKTLDWVEKKSADFMRLMSYYKCAMMEIETKLNVLSEEYTLAHERNPISSIKARLKTLPSIKKKMERLGVPMRLESIEEHLSDIAGVRVVCPFIEDVYNLANALLAQDDVVLIKKKDYIADPKPNGYRSLHLIVTIPIFLAHEKRMMRVEIQLRTMAMDFWASLEHQLLYKKNALAGEEVVSELYQCAQISAHLDARMDALRKKVDEEDHKQAQMNGESRRHV